MTQVTRRSLFSQNVRSQHLGSQQRDSSSGFSNSILPKNDQRVCTPPRRASVWEMLTKCFVSVHGRIRDQPLLFLYVPSICRNFFVTRDHPQRRDRAETKWVAILTLLEIQFPGNSDATTLVWGYGKPWSLESN